MIVTKPNVVFFLIVNVKWPFLWINDISVEKKLRLCVGYFSITILSREAKFQPSIVEQKKASTQREFSKQKWMKKLRMKLNRLLKPGMYDVHNTSSNGPFKLYVTLFRHFSVSPVWHFSFHNMLFLNLVCFELWKEVHI